MAPFTLEERANDAPRLMSKITATPAVAGCFEFSGYRDPDGYGRIYWRGKQGYLAHRAAYELAYGPIPAGLTIDHLCSNPPCIRYEHLEAVTSAENSRRASARRTHCRNGHEWTTRNTYWYQGGRHCRTCNAAAQRRYQSRKRLGLTADGLEDQGQLAAEEANARGVGC